MATLTPPERDALIRDHMPYAKRIAETVARDLPRWVAFNDLHSAANEGLIHAADRFDPDRGASFSSFAYYRVRGAVYDYLRRTLSSDPYHRARASAQAAVDDLIESAGTSLPRSVADPRAAAASSLAGILEDAATSFTLGEIGAAANAAPAPETDPERGATQGETHDGLRRAMQKLPERERTMIDGVYFQSLTIEQAGASMGLTKSWASRLHARALTLMRDAIGDDVVHL